MQKVKGLIPHLFTAGNLVGGILAIILALNGRLDLAPYFIFASAVLDFLDGFVARLLKVQGELGKQLDSLADMVTFGVAPGIIVYVLLLGDYTYDWYGNWVGYSAISAPDNQGIMIFSSFMIPVFAMFRLAKFNLDKRQSDSFIGVPTPAMTIFFASIPLMMDYTTAESFYWQGPVLIFILNPITLAILSLVFSILMVAELPLFALKFKTFGWKGNEIRYIFLAVSLILLVTLLFWALPLIILLYILLSVINNLFSRKDAGS